ncbi:alpha-D-ribose 1-methylphosphonate 5-triphosphate synthase subunit PhnH [Halomonas campaniensis]|uniref:Alpha-D-ribose 1-methylphosphonate 5-triphosphate synthase subunit PhnH n=1 Tax=Halomonas campaniensis TaxID=213554 RepID=A0A7W5PAH8_9GAMM|nr:phosphonate C-P lyase system protein PhnH [Halomonas campaniensis]MBB3330814.1 alpha-D-ribose 1-methylphosphonate 5-triphosphate synthase subunit PhnH [Halomonas campaniensis]
MNDPMTLEAPRDVRMGVWQPPRQQRAFRGLLTAFSYPGRVVHLADDGESATLLLLATLTDGASRLADPERRLAEDDIRRLGVRSSAVESADFVLCGAAHPPQMTPRLGSLENPEQGATLIIQVPALEEGIELHLTGPGIQAEQTLRVAGVDPAWWRLRDEWNVHFPLGVDLILASERAVAVLPRTTRLTVEGVH